MIYFTADWHLGEDRFEIMQRPYSSKLGHINSLMAYHNSIVKPEDTVYVNGDVLYQRAEKFLLKQIDNFHGHKILIRGNHDRPFSDDDFKPYFEQIIPEGEGIEVEEFYVTHYPSRIREDKFNLVGHIHSAWKVQLNAINVGVDVHHFRPVSLEQIRFLKGAIFNFYDQDVWSAYHPNNAQFFDNRGKKSTYFGG